MPRRKKSESGVQPETGDAAVAEQVQQVPLADLHPFEGHPFKVLDDDSMAETVESIRQMGVANPLIVRPDPDGGYEIISGHRRYHAVDGMDCQEETAPTLVSKQPSGVLQAYSIGAYYSKWDTVR